MGPPAYNAERAVDPNMSTDRVLNNTTLTLHNLPDIPSPPQIVGLLTVPPRWAGPDHLGYQVSDFLAFKALFHGVGHKDAQIWLSSLNIEAVMKQTDATYAHGDTAKPDDIKQGKDVAHAVDTGSINYIEDSKSLFDQFMTETGNRSSKGRHLIIIVCGETTPEGTIIFDWPTKLTATKADLHRKLTPGCTVTMISSALFSGGYTVNPFIGDKPSLPLSPEIMTEIHARHCGGAFIDNMIRHLTCRYSPLLSKEDRDLDLPIDLSQMAGMSQIQEELYCLFHLGVRRILSSRLSKFSARHSFEWADSDDAWPFDKRVGPKLDFWRQKWSQLKDVPSDAKEDAYVFLSGAFGGTKSSQITHIKLLVKQLLESCPSDWGIPANEIAKQTFTSLLESTDISEPRCIDIFDMVEYRCSSMILADLVVDILDLPRPGDSSCRDWDIDVYKAAEIPGSSIAKARTEAFAALTDRVLPKTPVPPRQNRDKLSRGNFWRPAFYLSAAIAMKVVQENKDPAPSMAVEIAHRDVYRVLDTIFRKQVELVVKHPGVMDLGKQWIEGLDLKNASSRSYSSVSPSVGMEGSRHAGGFNALNPYWGMLPPDITPKRDSFAQRSPPAALVSVTDRRNPLGDHTSQTKVALSEDKKAAVSQAVAMEPPPPKVPRESMQQLSIKAGQDKFITPTGKVSTSRATTPDECVLVVAESPQTPAIAVSPPTPGNSPAKKTAIAPTISLKTQPFSEQKHTETMATMVDPNDSMQGAIRETEPPNQATNLSAMVESTPAAQTATETVVPACPGSSNYQLLAQIMQIGGGQGLSEKAARDIMALLVTKQPQKDDDPASGSTASSSCSAGVANTPVTPPKPDKPSTSVSSNEGKKEPTGWQPPPDTSDNKPILFEEDMRRRAWRTAVKDKDIKMADEAAKNGNPMKGFEVVDNGQVFKVTAPLPSERRSFQTSLPGQVSARMTPTKAPRTAEIRPSGRLVPQFRNVVQDRKPPTEEELARQW